MDIFDAKNFIWTGDAIYTENDRIEGLQSAFQNLSSNEYYNQFRKKTKIYGTWDDHGNSSPYYFTVIDFGVNDGGKEVADIPTRKEIFRSFLGYSDSVPSFSHPSNEIYHTFIIGESPAAIRFILLDTRSYRDSHWIRSIGEYRFIPLSGLFAAGIRLIYTTLGYGREHPGDILGETQWNWLENVLEKSATSKGTNINEEDFVQADFHVIVSSIQIFTSNPIMESWNHFPVAKKRLMNLLQKYNPSGLVFLSGDIHASEISTATVQHSSSSTNDDLITSQWYEITSSGLTHNCRGSFITRPICPLMMDYYHTHRLPLKYSPPNDTFETSVKDFKNRYSMERNIGVIKSYIIPSQDQDHQKNNSCSPLTSYLEIEIYSLPLTTKPIPVLTQKIYPHHHNPFLKTDIETIEYVTFPYFSSSISNCILLITSCCSVLMILHSILLILSLGSD